MGRPTLVIVSGPPGSGKTTLAREIANAIGCPMISRDEIKEGMVHAEGPAFQPSEGDALTMRTFPLFFEVIRVLLAGGVSVVAEAAFQNPAWRKGLTPLLPSARLRIIRCRAAAENATERMRGRISEPRRAAHADSERLARGVLAFQEISIEAPSLVVETTDGYRPDLSAIVAFVKSSDG